MILNWNEIKERAIAFSKEWENDFNEDAEAKSFMDGFFNVFGIPRRRVASFETFVRKENGKQGFIDLLWKGNLLIEFKSKGKDLEKAHQQAKDYFPGLKDHELPKYILVSDFERFKLYDLDDNKSHEFLLKDFVHHVNLFGFISGYQKKVYKEQDPANIKAAELMGKLHDRLEEIGYTGHPLEVYLVRILFLLFAEDTTIFNKQQFQEFIEQRTSEDGSDLASKLQELFQVLNTPKENRFKNLDEQLADFPYVNGKLFEENLPTASFDAKMRLALLDCCYIDWSKISPAIFGSMFQSVMNPKERRNLGAHYTSETNILKLIKPLFLDELWAEFESLKDNKNKLPEFHKKLSNLKFLDPACGCGNFLIITYRELRLLEIEILRALNKTGQGVLDVREIMRLDVDMMFGIEYEEFPARIAEVAMWLIDHQMNMLVSNEFGQYFVRLPLKKAAKIVHGDALEIDWASLLNFTNFSNLKETTTSHSLNEQGESTTSPSMRGLGGVPNTNSLIHLGGVPKANFSHITPFYLVQHNIQIDNLIFNDKFLPYNPNIKEYSKSLRKAGNLSEVLLWKQLRADSFLGFSFYRQKPILNFIADFYCKELNLVIEIDGSAHHTAEAMKYDNERDRQMKLLGLHILRIDDIDVKNNINTVLQQIEEAILNITEKANSINLSLNQTPPIPLKEWEDSTFFKEVDDENLKENIHFNYILGNPPFIGSNIMKQNQRDQIIKEFGNNPGGGTLDYVTGWYIKAAKYLNSHSLNNTSPSPSLRGLGGVKTKVAFVSTNSIVQGEQTSILWGQMLNKYAIKIHFAHRTFKWSNEAKGNAAVYCVIIGFANYETSNKTIFDYEDIKGEAHEIKAKNINAYLIDAKDILVEKKTKPICNVPNIIKGNYYAKSEGLIIEEEDLDYLVTNEPNSKKWIKLLIGADEFINNRKRYCLWLVDCPPDELRKMPLVMERVNRVREDRLKSTDKGMQNLAPTRFRETNNPEKCLVIPVVSSESRKYIPMGFITKDTISTNANLIMPNGTLYHFGILMSSMHMAWVKAVCGRLESRFRYSKDIVYNNYPWPENPTEKQIKTIEEKAQNVLDARAKFQFPLTDEHSNFPLTEEHRNFPLTEGARGSSLADLYNPLTMPPALIKAHNELDKAVDLAYRPQAFTSEANRMVFLFELYEKYTANLFTKEKKPKKKNTK